MKIATVVILYRPDPETIAFVETYASENTPVVAVWNEFPQLDSEPFGGNEAITLLGNPANIGLASALNIGIERAFADGADRVLLLDQDSRPRHDMAASLSAALDSVSADGIRVGLIGPTLRDRKAGGAVNAAGENAGAYQLVSGLSTSGSLIDRAAFEAVGRMWDPLFIDGIDHEWCYRAQGRGFNIVQSRTVEMDHDMGDAGINFFGRYKPIHRSPFRHYHIVRNTLWLAGLDHIPKSFSRSELTKLAYRIPTYLLVSSSKFQTLNSIFRGLRDGLFAKHEKP